MAEEKGKKKKEDFYSFEDVLDELKLNEDELKKMVSEGELRAFREEDHIKFKKEDVDNLKKGKITEPTVFLPAEEILKPAEEKPLVEEPSEVTEEAPFTDTDITIPSLEEEKPPEVGPEDQKTFVEEETGGVTTPIPGVVEGEATFVEEAVTEAGETVTEEFAETVAEKPVLRPPRPPTAIRPRPSRIQPITLPPPKVRIHPIFIVIIGFTFLVLLFIGSLLSDTFRVSTGKANCPVGITRELGQLVVDIFGIKDEETPEPDDNINLDKYKP